MSRRAALTCLAAAAALLTGCSQPATTGATDVPTTSGTPSPTGTPTPTASPSPTAVSPPPGATGSADAAPAGVPALQVETVVSGLENAWDLGFLPDGGVLVTERPGRVQLVRDGAATEVEMDLSSVYARGEGGLMGLLVHPDFASSGSFSTCAAHAEGGEPVDVRVQTWQLSQDDAGGASAVADPEPLLTGLPLNPSGRHSGCRLALGASGELLVSTGDTADPAVPQDLASLGGKTLRADLSTGDPLPGAPLPEAPYVWSYGHRNLQGIAVRPGTDQVFTAEHGPDVDDEVNRIVAGANYGWDPGQGGTVDSYDESVPMTDTERFPDAIGAVWTSGEPTEAVSGAAFLTGEQWGALDGSFVVAALKGQKVLAMQLDDAGTLTGVVIPPELDGTLGRLRSVRQGPDGALWLTTDNGAAGEGDAVLRVSPQA